MDLEAHTTPSERRIAAWLVDSLEVEPGDAKGLASAVRDTFPKGTVITDWDVPDKPTRALLYRLYRAGLVETHTVERPREEDGRLWRYHHWVLNLPKGWPAEADDAADGAGRDDLYLQLPHDAWAREGSGEAEVAEA